MCFGGGDVVTLSIACAVETLKGHVLSPHGLVLFGEDVSDSELGVHGGGGPFKLDISSLDLLDSVGGIVLLDNGEHAVLANLGSADTEGVEGGLGGVEAGKAFCGLGPLFHVLVAEFDEESVVPFGESPDFIVSSDHLVLYNAHGPG